MEKEETHKTENEDFDNSKTSEINEKHEEEKKELSPEEKIKVLEDKLTRSLAEMENQRRRYEKEKEEAFEYGGFSFAKETLNLIDNLERSKQSLENDETLKKSEALKKISEHLEIIYKDTLNIFSKNNINIIKSINEKLDPNFHQAMMEIEDDSKEPGTIVQEIQKGFMIKDRLLRPSLVAVSKKSSKSSKDNKLDNKKTEEKQEKKDKN
tara:strand:- start:558 stop:1187 length:630 start_codon:yes stop_codon:yes gene_type:complete